MENLMDWRNGKKKSKPFAIPIVWREVKNHIVNCYLCMINLKRINHKNKHYVQYSDVPSAIRPIHHGLDLPVHESDGNMEYSSDSKCSVMTVIARYNAYKPEEEDQHVPLTQTEFNNLTQDQKLLKESAQLFGSCLKEKHLWATGTMFYWY